LPWELLLNITTGKNQDSHVFDACVCTRAHSSSAIISGLLGALGALPSGHMESNPNYRPRSYLPTKVILSFIPINLHNPNSFERHELEDRISNRRKRAAILSFSRLHHNFDLQFDDSHNVENNAERCSRRQLRKQAEGSKDSSDVNWDAFSRRFRQGLLPCPMTGNLGSYVSNL
jgi:hypothetical protein